MAPILQPAARIDGNKYHQSANAMQQRDNRTAKKSRAKRFLSRSQKNLTHVSSYHIVCTLIFCIYHINLFMTKEMDYFDVTVQVLKIKAGVIKTFEIFKNLILCGVSYLHLIESSLRKMIIFVLFV
jgi:hypothetical protein